MPHMILLVFALVLFAIAAIWGATPPGEPQRLRLVAAGLACWVAAQLFT
ncbi:MAG TPA: hypothetical protein VK595_12155 [Vicinamibacterales bacterium]|nr:hypothetical protein [Vicinamibacterales bacterium]